ncbi:hypothetical protein [Frankia sp. Cj5]|uniref:hypothetical protein n=1 Tax=Frankia sp. Cj5 TaxID=2880978 RepID=UPI00351D478C
MTAVLYLWDLGASGNANDFYAAAVQAGTKSWKAFFFGSFDSSNFKRPAIGDAASRGQGTHLASSLPVHRRAMHGYPGSSVTTQHLRRLPPPPHDARTPAPLLDPHPYCRTLLLERRSRDNTWPDSRKNAAGQH